MEQDNPQKTWKDHAALIGTIIIGIVFTGSAIAKLSTIGAFEIQLVKQGIFADRTVAMWPARILTAAELAIGIGLLQPTLRRRLFASLSGAMLIAFSAWLAFLLIANKPIEDCGCFGDLLKMSPAVALTRNIALLAILTFSWKRITEHRNKIIPTVIVLASLIAAGIIAPPKYAPAPTEPDQPAPTESPFKPFVSFSDGEVDLTRNTHIIAFLSLDCEHCQETAMHLAGSATALPPIRVIYLGDQNQIPDFEGMSGSAFPWAAPDPGLFFDFIGEVPPRVYLIRDGNIVKYWDQDQFSIDAIIESIPE